MKMDKKWLTPVLAALLSSLALAAPDFTQYGYPNVAASLTLNPYDYVRLGIGSAVLTIPQGAFGQDPVRFELLRGDSSAWQSQAPSGQKVIYAFALRVTDLKTNQPVLRFTQPLNLSFYSKPDYRRSWVSRHQRRQPSGSQPRSSETHHSALPDRNEVPHRHPDSAHFWS